MLDLDSCIKNRNELYSQRESDGTAVCNTKDPIIKTSFRSIKSQMRQEETETKQNY